MPGLVPGIHVLSPREKKDVDGRAFATPKGLRPRRRDKPGHDEKNERAARKHRAALSHFDRHCEERSDEAIHISACGAMDCFASLAMTKAIRTSDCPSPAPSVRS